MIYEKIFRENLCRQLLKCALSRDTQFIAQYIAVFLNLKREESSSLASPLGGNVVILGESYVLQ